MKPTFVMTIGIPGSGKSTWVSRFRTLERFVVICPDKIRKKLTHDISNQALNIEVWAEAKKQVVEALRDDKTPILDACNVNTELRRDFLIDLPDCHKIARVFRMNPEIAYEHVSKDIQKGFDRSNVPESVVYRMYGEFLYTLKVVYDEFDKVYEMDSIGLLL